MEPAVICKTNENYNIFESYNNSRNMKELKKGGSSISFSVWTTPGTAFMPKSRKVDGGRGGKEGLL